MEASLNAGQHRDSVVPILQARVPQLLAIYAFGSRVTGTAGPESDLDLAVLVAGYADPLALFELAGDLAEVVGCAVDLLDMRAASTVMQYQIMTTGQRWWASDVQAALFEAMVLSEKTALDAARAGVLSDKTAVIERYVTRAREAYAANPSTFASDFTRQDAAILNIQRACEAALDMGQHLIRREKLGVPQVRAMCLACWRRLAGLMWLWPMPSNAWWVFVISRCTTIKPCNYLSPCVSSPFILMNS